MCLLLFCCAHSSDCIHDFYLPLQVRDRDASLQQNEVSEASEAQMGQREVDV